MSLVLLVSVIVKVVFMVGIVVSLGGILTWAERKESAMLQDRIGPNRASILGFRVFGLFHPLADGIKMMTKEDFIPRAADRFVFALAPVLALIPALLSFAVIPFGDVLSIAGHEIPLQIAQVDAGFMVILAVTSIGVYGIFLAGWGSNNKFALLGGLRAASQMISYEVALGVALVGVLMTVGSLRLEEVVAFQSSNPLRWGLFWQPLAFVVFFTAAIAETKRAPFDLPEAESEIVGYFLEYSGMRWGMFFLAEFMEIVVLAGLATTFFFGGWQVPFIDGPAAAAAAGHAPGVFVPLLAWNLALPPLLISLLQVGSFFFKVIALCYLQLLIRWTLPRFRYDQIMVLGWKILLPLALANILITGGVLIALDAFKG